MMEEYILDEEIENLYDNIVYYPYKDCKNRKTDLDRLLELARKEFIESDTIQKEIEDKCLKSYNKAIEEFEKIINEILNRNVKLTIDKFSEEKNVPKEFIFNEKNFYRALELIKEEFLEQLKELKDKKQ